MVNQGQGALGVACLGFGAVPRDGCAPSRGHEAQGASTAVRQEPKEGCIHGRDRAAGCRASEAEGLFCGLSGARRWLCGGLASGVLLAGPRGGGVGTGRPRGLAARKGRVTCSWAVRVGAQQVSSTVHNRGRFQRVMGGIGHFRSLPSAKSVFGAVLEAVCSGVASNCARRSHLGRGLFRWSVTIEAGIESGRSQSRSRELDVELGYARTRHCEPGCR